MLDALKATPAFVDCTISELEKVAQICDGITVKKGEQLFEPDSPADTVYVVVNGAIELRFYAIYYNEPQPVPIDRLFKGDLIGWSALSEGGRFTLAAVALQDTELLRMRGDKLQRLCADNHHFGYVVQRNVGAIIARRFTLVLKMLIGIVQDSFKRREPGV
jgi:CRP-like cAMP-binding protein